MRSLLKVIKQAGGADPGAVVEIPDLPASLPAPERAAPAPPPQEGVQGEVDRQMAQQARQEAERLGRKIVQLAHQERDSLLEQAGQEAQQLRAQAVEEGRRQGCQEKKEDVDRVLREMNRALAELTARHQQFMEDYAQRLQEFAVEVAQKILCRQIQMDEGSMAELVHQAVGAVKKADWVTVELSARMPALVEQLKKELEAPPQAPGRPVQILAREDLPPGSCVVETPAGLVDASISVQLERLREYLQGEKT